MFGWILCLVALCFYRVYGQGECTDHRGRVISHGLHYVPGPDTCTLCVCENGLPKVCKAVLCSPPQDCRSFRVGHTCCEFICLDDVVKPPDTSEANVRLAAGGAATVVLLTVALVVYRVRKQKRRRPPHADDQRSLTSIGYISGSMGYMGGTCETALAAWKPPGNYLPRGEAPPPYDEAIAQCRSEPVQTRVSNEPQYHRTYPTSTMEALVRPDDPLQCTGHGYANIPRPLTQMSNPQSCYNAPLLQAVHQAEPRDPTAMPPHHHPLATNVMGFPSAIRLTGSLGAISNRGLLSILQRDAPPERTHHVPGFYTSGSAVHTSLHRTIPRISTATDTRALESAFSRADRGLGGEIRRSFHRPQPVASDTGRSMPRNLNLAAAASTTASQQVDISSPRASSTSVCERARAHAEEMVAGCASAEAKPCKPTTKPPQTDVAAPQTLPLTIDKPSCVCSYEGVNGGAVSSAGAGTDAAEDADDYRSECENCKSASSSRWVLEEGWSGEEEDGTQTLQRRVPPPAPPPPATATLPQPVTKQPRTVMGPPSNWENWFNTIPDSDSESEEE